VLVKLYRQTFCTALNNRQSTYPLISGVHNSYHAYMPSVLWVRHCWLGDRKGVRPAKSSVLVCW